MSRQIDRQIEEDTGHPEADSGEQKMDKKGQSEV